MGIKTRSIGIVILFIGIGILSLTLNRGYDMYTSANNSVTTEQYILFTLEYGKNTYLINYDKELVNMWESEYIQGLGTYLLENGDLIRSDSPGMTNFPGGGFTGHVEKFSWNGTLLWEFEYSTSMYCLHHDIEPLPNGNILMIAWEYKNATEAIAAGRKPSLLSKNLLWPDHIIEVQPTDIYGGNIVWEWHVWDHLIQDYDPTKKNYGNVAAHPELIDINYGPTDQDWNHINSIDYNEQFDQILLSVCYFNEIWVIDHSTTTQEAAGHTGGKSGKGGDLLYRWGNPEAYRAGFPSDQKLGKQHDARWIKPGCPGEGNILVFNNENTDQNRVYSSVDEIIPPVDDSGIYTYNPGYPYGPQEPVWKYTTDNPPDLYARHLSGAQRLPNGNTLICNGMKGIFFEVTPRKETVWEYINPYEGIFPIHLVNRIFKVQCYFQSLFEPNLDCDENLNLNWSNVQPGDTVTKNFSIQNAGGPGSLLDWEIKSWPEWGTWTFTPHQGENLSPNENPTIIKISVMAPLEEGHKYTGSIKIVNQNNNNDYCLINASLTTIPKPINNHPNPPVNPIPHDNAINIDLNPVLSVNVSDPDNDTLNVTFYDASNNSVIGMDTGVTQGETASVIWHNLAYDTLYKWYATASDGMNMTHSVTWSFTTQEEPGSQINADFHWTPTTKIYINELIHFFDDTIVPHGYIVSWQWDFGDGSYETIQNPTHSYLTVGKYDVKLIVVDNNNNSASKTKQLTIMNSPPIADAGPDQIVNKTQVIFNGTHSNDPDGTIVTYKWNFGDGTNSTGMIVTHNYSTDGIYTATLNVTDNSGVTHEDYCIITVDTVTPKTNITFRGTLGENNWYMSTVTTTLIPNDTTSRINKTYYKVNQGQWNTYIFPFNISNEGIHTLSVYSSDKAGNIENIKIWTIKIDKTAPTITITQPDIGSLYIFGRKLIPTLRGNTIIMGGITVEITATSTPADIKNIVFYVEGEKRYNTSQQPYIWEWGQSIGRHTLEVILYDEAGHYASAKRDVTIFSILPRQNPN